LPAPYQSNEAASARPGVEERHPHRSKEEHWLISTTISVTNVCVSNRTVKIAFSKRAKAGRVRFNGKTIKAKRIHGRLRATVSFRGMKAAPGSYAAVIMRSKMHGKWSSQTRLYKLC
jgi:hypothetical protein